MCIRIIYANRNRALLLLRQLLLQLKCTQRFRMCFHVQSSCLVPPLHTINNLIFISQLNLNIAFFAQIAAAQNLQNGDDRGFHVTRVYQLHLLEIDQR